MDRITVTYTKYSYPDEGPDSASIIQHHYRTREENIVSDAMYSDIPYDTIENINGHLYSIILFTYSNPRTSQYGKKIASATIIKNNLICFTYETFSNKNDLSNELFIRNSKFYLTRSQPINGR